MLLPLWQPSSRFHVCWSIYKIPIPSRGRVHCRCYREELAFRWWRRITDFLKRFKCRRVVTTENLSQVILEISKQDLVQKLHLMISSLQSFVQQLKQYPQFQTISAVEGFYDSLKATTKKVLSCLTSNPQSEGDRCIQILAAICKRSGDAKTSTVFAIYNSYGYYDWQEDRSYFH